MFKTLIRLIYIIGMYYLSARLENMYMLVFSIGILVMMYLEDITGYLSDLKKCIYVIREDDKES